MHLSRVITYPPQNVENFLENGIMTVDLKKGINQKIFTEIMVPTSSYRMGVSNIGYGLAVIGNWLELFIDISVILNCIFACPTLVKTYECVLNRCFVFVLLFIDTCPVYTANCEVIARFHFISFPHDPKD